MTVLIGTTVALIGCAILGLILGAAARILSAAARYRAKWWLETWAILRAVLHAALVTLRTAFGIIMVGVLIITTVTLTLALLDWLLGAHAHGNIIILIKAAYARLKEVPNSWFAYVGIMLSVWWLSRRASGFERWLERVITRAVKKSLDERTFRDGTGQKALDQPQPAPKPTKAERAAARAARAATRAKRANARAAGKLSKMGQLMLPSPDVAKYRDYQG